MDKILTWEAQRKDAIAALECALHNYQIDRVGPYTLAIISEGDLIILRTRVSDQEREISRLREALERSTEYHRMHCEADGDPEEEFRCAQRGLAIGIAALAGKEPSL